MGKRFGKTPQNHVNLSVKAATDFLLDMIEEFEKKAAAGPISLA